MPSKISSLNWQEMTLPSQIAATSLRLEIIADHWIFKPLNLTAASFRILVVLSKCGQISPIDIIGYLGGTKSNITQRLNFLRRSGWIEIERPQQGDRRKILVKLSTVGKQKLSQVKTSFVHHSLHVEKFFTKKELQNFLQFIIKLNKGLDACEKHLSAKRLNK